MMAAVMDSLTALFADKLVNDDREAIYILGDYGLYPPSVSFWNQLILLLLIQTAMQCLFSIFIYFLIVRQRGTVLSYFVGYFLVLPAGLYFPFCVIDYLDLVNTTIQYFTVPMAIVIMFRVFEAMYGTSPETVETSLGTYIVYFSSIIHFEWDAKTCCRRRITWAELTTNSCKVLLHFHIVSLLLSIAMHVDYQPFSSNTPLDEFSLSLDLLSPSHLANNYFMACLTFFFLSLTFELAALGEQLKGFYTKPIFNYPLWTSRSPREFWGRNWNLVIHRTLKHGTYLPARKFVSSSTATFLTFLASGVLHDYCWTVIFYKSTWTPRPLKVTAFFVWCGLTLMAPINLDEFVKNLPTPIVSTLVVLTVLPVAHWFSGDWCAGGVFSDCAIGLWHVRKLPTA
jgi:hypothetical protein